MHRLTVRATTLVVVLAISGLTAVATPPPASATRFDYMPTTTADVVDPADGLLSLREVLGLSGTDALPASSIALQPGATYTLTRCAAETEDDNTTGDLDQPDEPVSIAGTGSTIRQTCAGERVYELRGTGAELQLAGVTITGGDSSGDGGGIHAFASMVALGPGTILEGNRASGDGGGVAVQTAAVGIVAGPPGGLTLEGALLRGNTSSGSGGGAYAEVPTDVGTSTIVGNVAEDSGGGIAVQVTGPGGLGPDGTGTVTPAADATVQVRRSTIAQNRAGDDGGGVDVAGGSLDVTVSTLVANRAADGAQLSASELGLTASIVALGSGSADCVVGSGVAHSRVLGSDGSCDSDPESAGGGKLGALHPLLAPLAANGGPTPTMRPIVGSQVLDAEPEQPCAGGPESQNGLPRPQGEGCEVGSFEGTPLVCEAGFPDVADGHAFGEEICRLAQLGITTGFGDGTFRPAAPVTRQSMAAFLHRLAGAPPLEPPASPTFADVGPTHPFVLEVEWLADAGIATGFADGTFRGGLPVSRQAMAAFLHRVVLPEDEPATGPTFSDVSDQHPFSTEIRWLADAGVAEGYEDGTFRPSVPVSRQAMAAFLLRVAEEHRLAGL